MQAGFVGGIPIINFWRGLGHERRQRLDIAERRDLRRLLLPPTLRRKIRWRGYRGFALLSTARLLPLLAVLTLIGAGADQALDWQATQEANRILSVIRVGFDDRKPESEAYR